MNNNNKGPYSLINSNKWKKQSFQRKQDRILYTHMRRPINNRVLDPIPMDKIHPQDQLKQFQFQHKQTQKLNVECTRRHSTKETNQS